MKNVDWFCRPTTFEEACEIVERAIANGATMRELVKNSVQAKENRQGDLYDRGVHLYDWNTHKYWGVTARGYTYTGDKDFTFLKQANFLTIKQVREYFPLPPVSDSSVDAFTLKEPDSVILRTLDTLKEKGVPLSLEQTTLLERLTKDAEWVKKAGKYFGTLGDPAGLMEALRSGELPFPEPVNFKE